MKIPFSKYQGTGNDFILIDDREGQFPNQNAEFIRSLCDRRFGIGADGLILLQRSSSADFKMRIFNSDGGEPGMCGNGLRCLIHFLKRLKIDKETCHIEVTGRIYFCRFQDEKIKICLGSPKILYWDLAIAIENEPLRLFVLDTGVPHAVVFTEDLEKIDLMQIGRKLRFHPKLAPEGANVDFAKILPSKEIRMRTYERGVEGETLMCGTGAAAVAFAAFQIYRLSSPIKIQAPQNEHLEFIVTPIQKGEHEIEMTGPAAIVFTGEIEEGTCKTKKER